jgi:membrane fusion protein, macrolide-specific efflux system
MTDKGQKMRKRNLFIALALLMIVIASIAVWKSSQKSEVTYREISVSRDNLEVSILTTGIVQPQNRLEIKPPIAGRAETVLVDAGYQVKKGQILVWMSSTERAALLDAARARGPEELKTWEDYYKATPVLAPIDGTIIQRNIQPGQTFATADAILVMSDRLTIQAQVDETDIAQIRLKQKAKIILDAYPGNTIPAHVDKIAYDAKTVNNVTTYIVDVLPEETPKFVRSGMTANVSFLAEAKKDVLVLPSEAIKKKPDGTSYVMLKASNGQAKPIEQSVKTGISDGRRTEVVAGLSEGDAVLVPRLRAGGGPAGGSNPFSPFSQRRPAR